MTQKLNLKSVFLLISLGTALLSVDSRAQNSATHTKNPAFRSTAYALPRFVSLGSSEAFVRSGPGQQYPVLWVFKKKSLPVEIVLEYDIWRKIKDSEGQEGWVHQSLLSGKRTGLIRADDLVPLHRKPAEDSRLLANLEPQALLFIEACNGTWCSVDASGYKGWVEQKFIWGIYENEILN